MSAAKRLYGQYRYRCKIRNIYFDLTFDQFVDLTKQNCAYCGAEPKQSFTNGHASEKKYFYNGLDRKNNAHGYYPANCAPACGRCNAIKSDNLTYEEMMIAMQALKDAKLPKRNPRGTVKRKVRSL